MESLVDRGPGGPPESLYIHVPYCRDRCTYCAFPTVADQPSEHAALVRGLLAELSRHAVDAPLTTIYIGGGTPALLDPALLETLLQGIRRAVPLAPDTEITLEANPNNIRREVLPRWRDLGISRLSLGIQTFEDHALHSLARLHDGRRAESALETVATLWESTWSADLLMGWHGQTAADVEQDTERLLAYQPPHVAVYGLTVEPGTPLARWRQKTYKITSLGSFLASCDSIWDRRLEAAGYERYEVSNFARPGHRSRHNQTYWRNGDYLGLGPGASSSVHPYRWTNHRNPTTYLEGLQAGRSVRDRVERLRPLERLIETLAVGLRTRDGIPTRDLDRRFSPAWRPLLERAGDALLATGRLHLEARRLVVPAGELVRSDAILRELVRCLPEPAPTANQTEGVVKS